EGAGCGSMCTVQPDPDPQPAPQPAPKPYGPPIPPPAPPAPPPPVLRAKQDPKPDPKRKADPKAKTDPKPEADPKPKLDDDTRRRKPPRLGRIYVTYLKIQDDTGLIYTGRTDMVVDLDKPLRPQAILAMKTRGLRHHKDEAGFSPSSIDEHLDVYAVGNA